MVRVVDVVQVLDEVLVDLRHRHPALEARFLVLVQNQLEIVDDFLELFYRPLDVVSGLVLLMDDVEQGKPEVEHPNLVEGGFRGLEKPIVQLLINGFQGVDIW